MSVHSLFEIPELDRYTAGKELVRIPPELNVPFTRRVRAIVDTAEFQRLGQVTQLGLVSRVYPGARHTRFEHALGVFYNAVRYLAQLGHDPRFVERVDAHAAELLMVSALLHDLGHWPFCHSIEDIAIPGLARHEDFAMEFLSPGSELADVLSSEWRLEAAEVWDVLSARRDTPTLKLLRSILSGPVDIDKLDYLERDSLHAGVPYGRNFDKQRLIQSLMLNAEGDGLALTSKGRTAAELMVFARYVMFSEVYWHHAVRASTAMFTRAFYDLHPLFNTRELFLQGEGEMIRQLLEASQGQPAESLLEGVLGRKRSIHKRVAEFTVAQHPETYQLLARLPYVRLVEIGRELAARCSARLGEPLSEYDLLIDAPPAHREVEVNVPIYFPREKTYRPLDEVSPVVAVLARTQFDDIVKRVRLYAHPRVANRLAGIADLEAMLVAATGTSIV